MNGICYMDKIQEFRLSPAYVYAFFENQIMRYVGVTAKEPQYRIMAHSAENKFISLFQSPGLQVRCVKTNSLYEACQIEYGQILRYAPILNGTGRSTPYVPPAPIKSLWPVLKNIFAPINTPIDWRRATVAPLRREKFGPIKHVKDCWLSRCAVTNPVPEIVIEHLQMLRSQEQAKERRQTEKNAAIERYLDTRYEWEASHFKL